MSRCFVVDANLVILTIIPSRTHAKCINIRNMRLEICRKYVIICNIISQLTDSQHNHLTPYIKERESGPSLKTLSLLLACEISLHESEFGLCI